MESVTKYGLAASPSDEVAVRTAVESYYSALIAGEYPAACRLLSGRLLASMTRSFGKARGVGVCEKALMVLLGSRPGAGFSHTITVTGVRIKGDQAFALISTQTTPSGVYDMNLEHGAWKVGSITPFPLGPAVPPPS